MAPTNNSTKEDPTAWTGSKTKNAKMVKQRAEDHSLSLTVTSQVWQKSGRCPEGTIPVRRIQRRDLLKAHSIEEYGRKRPSFSHRQVVGQLNENLNSFVQLQNHSVSLYKYTICKMLKEIECFARIYLYE